MDLDFPGCQGGTADAVAPVVTLNVAVEPLTPWNGPTWLGRKSFPWIRPVAIKVMVNTCSLETWEKTQSFSGKG